VGELKRRKGRPRKEKHLFKVIGEKLPLGSLRFVENTIVDAEIVANGVYMAHDSMGVARYGGRGNIFRRLRSHRRKYRKQLVYFSFYIIENKIHEREIENAILRAAGPQMILNKRKLGDGINAGNITDYEASSYFFERHSRSGRKKKRVVKAK
jgi:hypothetical protein